MNRHQDIDDRLVSWTDQLLAGYPTDEPEDLGDLADVVRKLKQTIAPESPPSPTFRANLQTILLREWSRRPQKKHSLIGGWQHNRAVSLSLIAACLAGILLIVTLLNGQAENGENAAQGTSAGSLPWFFGVAALAVVIAGIGAWFFKGRGKS